ncbi:hypothetical protein BpHYR1_054179 [Brachionus plicatilis]|uniref:Uncharacterized protein n=1 Tax=Brachionus plicatilis TaxID=10195 RepID=A0A3M7RDT8_BRAPC|nr:hypothetical protein BpHYR1_054179 [Brachionus plicatilis]
MAPVKNIIMQRCFLESLLFLQIVFFYSKIISLSFIKWLNNINLKRDNIRYYALKNKRKSNKTKRLSKY